MKKQFFNLPNCITFFRIIGTLCLLFMPACSTMFLLIYTLAGVTDVLDGWLARKTGTSSAWGAKLDSMADLLFYAVMFIKILPMLWMKLSVGTWYTIGVILFLRVSAYTVAAIRYRQFGFLHTYLNKLTGLAVFAIPYVISLPFAALVCRIICGIAIAASGEELLLHLCRREYDPNIQTILSKKKICALFRQNHS